MLRIFKSLFLLNVFIIHAWASDDWARGAHLVHALEGEVSLSELGEASLAIEPQDLPMAIGGLYTCEAEAGASVLLSASNRKFFLFRGPGQLGVERFEQIRPTAATWSGQDPSFGQSRMLLSMRSGYLLVDDRVAGDSSKLALETPLGRLTAGRALWQMRISFDQRSRIFDFEIACSVGRISFTDNRGESYALSAGQRLSGAGERMNPGIEIVEITENDVEVIEEFGMALDAIRSTADKLDLYLSAIQDLPGAQKEAFNVIDIPTARGGARPIIIEYAPRADSLAPFRGEIPPPSEHQAGMF